MGRTVSDCSLHAEGRASCAALFREGAVRLSTARIIGKRHGAGPAIPILCQRRRKRLISPRIAEPGIGLVAVRAGAGYCACGDTAADPYSRCRSGSRIGPGAAIWKNALLGIRAGSRPSRSRVRQDARSGHLFWKFERLRHAAANLQSLFGHAGHVICFRSAYEQ